jgi:hypothetical protein
MAKIQRSPDDINNKVKDQVQLLKLACLNYDNGNEIAALNIANTLRVLLHDTTYADGTPNSISALTHISKKNIGYLDTCRPNTNTKLTFTGLIGYLIEGVHDGIGGTAKYYPLLNKSLTNDWLDFNTWWNGVIFQTPSGSTLTRQVLTIKATNQEGGAHIDENIDERFDNFRYHYSGGVSVKGIKSGVVKAFDNIPVYPALRQIGYEVLESLKKVGVN